MEELILTAPRPKERGFLGSSSDRVALANLAGSLVYVVIANSRNFQMTPLDL